MEIVFGLNNKVNAYYLLNALIFHIIHILNVNQFQSNVLQMEI